MTSRQTRYSTLIAAALCTLAFCVSCNPVDLHNLLTAAKEPETLLQIEEGEDYLITFREPLIGVKELEKFRLVPTAKFGDSGAETWVYNLYNIAQNQFLFPIRISCRDGKIAEIRLPRSAAQALPRNAILGFVQSLAKSSFDLSAGQTVPDPAATDEIECQIPEKALTVCLGRYESVHRENNIAEYRYALRTGRGRHAADVLIRCAYRELPTRLLGADIFVSTARLTLAPEGARLKLYHTGYRRAVPTEKME